MSPKHLKHLGHGHGHGHHKMHRHGGKHEKFGHPFRHPGHHMGKEFFKGKHHRGMFGFDCERGCVSETELPDTTTPNAETGPHDTPERNMEREFFKRMHYWRHGRGRCEKCDIPTTTATEGNAEAGEKNDVPAITSGSAEAGEKSDVPMASAENVEPQNRFYGFHHKGKHHFKHHRGMEWHGGNRFVPRWPQEGGDTTENETTTEGEGEGGVKQGYIRKHYRGHHGGKRGPKFRGPCPQCRQEEDAAAPEANIEEGAGAVRYMFKGRHHGGKWGHGPHKPHHGGWGRHRWCMIMVDVAVNTDDPENIVQEENVEVREVSSQETNAGQVMEQDGREEVGQEQTDTEAAEVLEVADNLRKSSLE